MLAGTGPESLAETMLHRDEVFWEAYNRCDLDGMAEFFTEDIEFYHDQGGVMLGAAGVLGATRDNLCSNPEVRHRREAVGETVRVFPMQDGEAVYGAILSGQHLFYVLERGQPERATGLARFTHLWLHEDGDWRMARVLSYDHGPAPYLSPRTAVALPEEILDRYVGAYRGARSGALAVERQGTELVLIMGDEKLALHPEKEGLFFARERDLTFEFTGDGEGRVDGMVVREGGEVAEEAVRLE